MVKSQKGSQSHPSPNQSSDATTRKYKKRNGSVKRRTSSLVSMLANVSVSKEQANAQPSPASSKRVRSPGTALTQSRSHPPKLTKRLDSTRTVSSSWRLTNQSPGFQVKQFQTSQANSYHRFQSVPIRRTAHQN